MASIKVHVGVFADPGTASCDFRGGKFLGAEQGDHHRTVLEKDPASDVEIAMVLEHGPTLNKILDALVPAEGFGIEGGARIGVWDE